jgi:glycosyltransferase involved in cell wall biosynthesis
MCPMPPPFKIHCFTICKNEADIIAYTLRQASNWADAIYVFDNGSTDATWEIVREEAKANPKIVPWKQDGKPFREGLRAEVFNAFKQRASDGDWWCRLDSDEEYIDDPRGFLSGVAWWHDVVWGASVEYYLSSEDVGTIDFSMPMEKVLPQLRWYRSNNSEQRFVRHRKDLVWPVESPWPLHMGVSSPRRIRLKHYKYRSPSQTQLRLDVRRQARAEGFEGWEHAKSENWKEMVSADPSADCHLDEKDSKFVIDERLMPSVEPSFGRKLIKQIMRRTGIWP